MREFRLKNDQYRDYRLRPRASVTTSVADLAGQTADLPGAAYEM